MNEYKRSLISFSPTVSFLSDELGRREGTTDEFPVSKGKKTPLEIKPIIRFLLEFHMVEFGELGIGRHGRSILVHLGFHFS